MKAVEGKGAYLRLLNESADEEVAAKMRRLQWIIVWCFIAVPVLWTAYIASYDAFVRAAKAHAAAEMSLLELAGLSSLIFCAFSAGGFILATVLLGLELRKHRPRRRP